LEHLAEKSDDITVNYILNGATDICKNNTDHKDKVPEGSLKFNWVSEFNIHGAVCFVKASINQMTIEFIETSGKLLHTIIIPNRFL